MFVDKALSGDDMAQIKECLDELLKTQVYEETGNIRSSVGSQSDKLVHWCHGAPGAVHLYALTYKVY